MNRRTYRNKWLKLRERYEKQMYRSFRMGFKEMALQIPFELLSETNYEYLLNVHISEPKIRNIYSQSYYGVGLHYGNKIGKAITKEQKAFSVDTFPEVFRRFLAQWLLENAGQRITSVKQTLVEYLVKIIADGVERNENIRDIARELEKRIRSHSFYRWQALRIARTETTAAANLGAKVAAKESSLVLVKEWIATTDSRTRRRPEDEYDHLEMDGVTVDQDDKFSVQGDMMDFPGDPEGRASNVINCRCTVAYVGKRDANGNLIFR